MKKVLVCIFISVFLVSTVSANDFATIGMEGLKFVNPQITQAVNLAICVSNLATCAEGMITGYIQQAAMDAIAKSVPEVAPVIASSNQVQNLIANLGAKITRELKVSEEGQIQQGSIVFGNEADSEIGNLINKDLSKEDITAKGVQLDQEKEFSTFIFKEKDAKVCIKDKTEKNCFENILESDKFLSIIKLDEGGNVSLADFRVNEKGGVYTLGDSTFEAPPNSHVYYKKEDGSPIVKLEENSEMKILPGPEGYSNLKGEVQYEGKNFKIGNNEIKGLDENLGKISVSNGKITKIFERTDALVDGIRHQTFKNDLNLYYEESFDFSAHSGENYFNYGNKKIWLGGSGFISTLEENNKVFPSMKDSGKGSIELTPINGEIELTENSKGNRFDLKSKGNFRLTNKGITLLKSPGSLKLFPSESGKGYDFNIDGEYSLTDGVLRPINNSNVKINTKDPVSCTISKTRNLDKAELDKSKEKIWGEYEERPHNFFSYMNDKGGSEENYAKFVYGAVAEVNNLLTKNNKGVTITALEVELASLSEGGLQCIEEKDCYEATKPISGYWFFGLDTFGSERDYLVSHNFVPEDIKYDVIDRENELHQFVQSATFPDMRTAIRAFAGVWAERKFLFERDYKKYFGEARFNQLSDADKYRGITLYYMAGAGAGRDFLTGKKTPTPSTETNADWRTATYEWVKRSGVFDASC